jgi:hypothetical protein
MKGLMDINFILYVLTLILVAAMAVSFFSVKYILIKEVSGEITLKEDKYLMLYSLDAAKAYAETSLKYSFFQACYDTLRNSGVNEKTFDGKKYSAFPSADQLVNALKKTTGDYLKAYLSGGYIFLTEYTAVFPEYRIEISENGGNTAIESGADSNIRIEKTREVKSAFSEQAVLEKEPLLKVSVNADCRKTRTFAEGRKSGMETDIKGVLDGVLSSKFAQEYSLDYAGSDIPECSFVFQQNTGNEIGKAKEKVLEPLNAEIPKLNKNEGAFEISMELLDADLKVEEKSRSVTSNGANKVTCRFVYTLTAYTKIGIKDTGSEKLLVSNGKDIAFESPQLIFYTQNVLEK